MYIALYNGCLFHHELIGYFYGTLSELGHTCIVYTTEDSSGWLRYYEKRFPGITILPCSALLQNIHLHEQIILLTDDDYSIDELIVARQHKFMKINHCVEDRQPLISIGLDVRPYTRLPSRKFWLPAYPLTRNTASNTSRKRILVSNRSASYFDMKALSYLDRHHQLIMIGGELRVNHEDFDNALVYNDLQAPELISMVASCHYFFYGTTEKSKYAHWSMSGFMSLACSCGLQIISNEFTQACYGLPNWLIYTDITAVDLSKSVHPSSLPPVQVLQDRLLEACVLSRSLGKQREICRAVKSIGIGQEKSDEPASALHEERQDFSEMSSTPISPLWILFSLLGLLFVVILLILVAILMW